MTQRPDDSDAGDLPAALALVERGLAMLADVDSWRLADSDVRAGVGQLDRLVRLAEGQSLRLIAEAGARGLPAQAGHGRLAHWVRDVTPTMSPRAAATGARRAEELFTSPLAADLATTRAATLDARLTGEQADVIVAAMRALSPPHCPVSAVDDDTFAAAQQFLLDQSAAFDAPQLRRLATHLIHRLDPDADERLAKDERAQERARGLTISDAPDGLVRLNGALTPQCGAALRAAIDAWSAPLAGADGQVDTRTPAQRRHDGLQRLAEQAIAQTGLLPSTHGSAYRIVVTAPHETLAAALDPARPGVSGLQPATLPCGTALSALTLDLLACEADQVPILVDPEGNPLDVGDTQYAFPAKQRTAIAARDKHCTFPGCQAPPPWCHAHHVIAASRGGPTSVENGTLLCGRHHRHVHRLKLSARLTEGQVIWDHEPRPHAGPVTTRAHQALDALVRRWRNRMRC